MSAPDVRSGGDSPELRRLTSALLGTPREPSVRRDPADASGHPAAVARHYLQRRRAREKDFPNDLFGDPAWDILLDLYVSSVERTRISVSSACLAAAVPTTTALRWIEKLVSIGLIVRTVDFDDRRRAFVSLADGVASRIEEWLVRTWPNSV